MKIEIEFINHIICGTNTLVRKSKLKLGFGMFRSLNRTWAF